MELYTPERCLSRFFRVSLKEGAVHATVFAQGLTRIMVEKLSSTLRLSGNRVAYGFFSLLLYGFWLIVAGGVSLPILIVGIPVVLVPIVLFRWTYRALASSPIPLHILLVVPFFVRTAVEMVKAAFTVAKWTLDLKHDLRSWIFAYPTEIEDRLGLLLLSTAVTLTPGTISVELDRIEGVLHIHALAPVGTTTEDVIRSVRVLEVSLLRAVS